MKCAELSTLSAKTLAGAMLSASAMMAYGLQPTPVQTAVEYLASPELEGRLTGSRGEQLAAEFIVQRLQEIGARPLPGLEGFLQPFEFTAGLNDGGTTLSFTHPPGERAFAGREEVQVLSFSENQVVTAPLVFAGYGISTTDESGFAYDSFRGLDVKDKIVLIFRYYPENIDQEKRTILSQRPSELRAKAQNARDRGAIGLLVTAGPAYPEGADIVPLTFDSALVGSNIAAASIGGQVARELFEASGKSIGEIEALQRRLDEGDETASGFELEAVTVTLDARINRERKTANNVVGYLPATGPNRIANEWVGIGAHYDHLGKGDFVSNSLARDSERGHAHFGADDNASGVAGVLGAAQVLAGSGERKRPVFLGFWTGEEIGLLGSTAFVRSGVIKTDQIVAKLNLDMVGRVVENKLAVLGVGSSSDWDRLVDLANVPVGFDLSKTSDPYTSSDSLAFYVAGVPVVHVFSGSHEDYHRPTDTADKINYADLERVARFTSHLALEVANAPERVAFVQVERQGSGPGGGGRGRRAFTGTIPDFTAEVNGLRLSGVIGGSPAATAGLREGDIIVEFAGRSIANIHEFTAALEDVKIGQETSFAYTRDGHTHHSVIIPAARR